jgi:hypothetical protein
MKIWPSELNEVLRDCRLAFVPKDRRILEQAASQCGLDLTQMSIRMNELYRGFVLKIYTDIVSSDGKWSPIEKEIGSLIIEHFWGQQLDGAELKTAWQGMMYESKKLAWSQLLAPFARSLDLVTLRAEVYATGIRLANIIAKADGTLHDPEAARLRGLEQELHAALHLGTTGKHQQAANADDFVLVNESPQGIKSQAKKATGVESQRDSLDDSLKKLESLIGLDAVKKQVEELTDFLRMQQQRRKAGLSVGQHNLHMVFKGNPGTGKTTVARIIADILRGLGILQKGQLIETDRGGLVAEYAGQTAVKTGKRIDEAVDGILFIDEAYSLVDSGGDDAFGREALQTLLKRMEDDRERLVVIFAGYPNSIDELLQSNPGLTSRVGLHFTFDDYSPDQLLSIFQLLCKEHQYQCLRPTRDAVHKMLTKLHEERNEHFGNGRVVRNIFEKSIRRMASRIAPIAPLTHELLTQIMPQDLEAPSQPTA